MKNSFTLFGILLSVQLLCAQQKMKEKVDLGLLKSDKITFFDSTIFKPKVKTKDTFTTILKTKKSTLKMPVFVAEGKYTLRVFKVDTLKKHHLRIHKVE